MEKSLLDRFKVDLNNYKKGKRINRGCFGVVYLVKDKKTDQEYAGKIINCDDDEEQSQNIVYREITIMSSVNHPTIIKFIGYSLIDFHSENNVTIIMDLAQNGSLSDFLKMIQKNGIPEYFTNTNKQILLIGISEGMKYLHDRNIIHRDLKLGNILLDENYHPLITDFGMSKFIDYGHSMSQSQFGGTLPYMAPEIIEGENYNRKADVYSFSILIYEIITNSFSYPELLNGTLNDFLFRKKVVDENYRPVFNEPIKESIRILIQKCWSKNPNDRPNFTELYKKFSSEDYFLDGVNKIEINNYIQKINDSNNPIENRLVQRIENLQDEIMNLKQLNENLSNDLINKTNELNVLYKSENDALKKIISIESFNSLSLKFQSRIISFNLSNDENNQFFNKINDLLNYLLQFNELNELKCISISTNNNNQYLNQVENEFQIQFSSNLIELIYHKQMIESNDFINELKKIDNFLIELKYPSNEFQQIYDSIINIKKNEINDPKSLKIKLYINQIEDEDRKFHHDININFIQFDSRINEIGFYRESIYQYSEMFFNHNAGIFQKCSNLTQIILPSSVTKLGDYLICECKALKEITIPNSVTKIGCFTFRYCSSLLKITIPSSVTTIGNYVFRDCTSLKKVKILAPIKIIPVSAFHDCSSLKKN